MCWFLYRVFYFKQTEESNESCSLHWSHRLSDAIPGPLLRGKLPFVVVNDDGAVVEDAPTDAEEYPPIELLKPPLRPARKLNLERESEGEREPGRERGTRVCVCV